MSRIRVNSAKSDSLLGERDGGGDLEKVTLNKTQPDRQLESLSTSSRPNLSLLSMVRHWHFRQVCQGWNRFAAAFGGP